MGTPTNPARSSKRPASPPMGWLRSKRFTCSKTMKASKRTETLYIYVTKFPITALREIEILKALNHENIIHLQGMVSFGTGL